ncbi:neuronal acetylcholine receptor subunit alpha-10-like [Babylonia areolata]|uniref:neuronal acetylcholine receptor subunit alpha-10-like n=1 Tax=Babylonia areolata TaxID=304850 RepID=UPI003FCF3A20
MAVTSAFLALHCLVLMMAARLTQAHQLTNQFHARLTDEQRLYRQLRKNYDPFTRPVFNASHAVVVKIGITLTQIFDLDEKNQVLTTNVWLDHEWHDAKLQWRPEDYSGLTVLRIPCQHIWKPDIVLYNSVEDYTDGYMQALAMVRHTGHVFWPPIVKFHSTCQIDITYFPFDDQVCTMKLGSWAYDGLQVDVVNRSEGVDLSNYVSNGEWQLLNVTAVRSVVRYSCCPEPFPDVRFVLYLRRRTLYYTYNVLIPCVMLSTLTLLVFWMSPESGEKVTLGLTVLLAFSVFMLLIAENMPATSNHVPLIGIYLTSVMALTSISVILAVVVSNINNRGRKDKALPPFLTSLITTLARFVCFRLHYVNAHVTSAGRDVTSGACLRPHVLYKGVENHVSNDSGCGLADVDANSGERRFLRVTPDRSAAWLGGGGVTACGCEERGQREGGAGRGEVTAGAKSCPEDLLHRLRQLLLREEERDKGDNLCRQWQEAAEVIDRCLFILFVLATLTTTVTSLLILPLTKHRLQADVDIFKS